MDCLSDLFDKQSKTCILYPCNEEKGDDSSSLASDKRELILLGLPNRDLGGFVLVGVLVLLSGSKLPDLGVT